MKTIGIASELILKQQDHNIAKMQLNIANAANKRILWRKSTFLLLIFPAILFVSLKPLV
jgi:hypothetical protein